MNYEERLAELNTLEEWLTKHGTQNWKQLFAQRRQDLNTAIAFTKAHERRKAEEQTAADMSDIMVSCGKCEYGFMAAPDWSTPTKPNRYHPI